MNINVSTDRTVAVDRGYRWLTLASCPVGIKCQLLTRHGVAVYGQYNRGAEGYVAWAPLPIIPPEIKELLK